MENNQSPTTHGAEKDTLVIDDRVLSHGFIQLPKLVLHSRILSRDAKLLYAVLLSYAWQEGKCFPGYMLLCDAFKPAKTWFASTCENSNPPDSFPNDAEASVKPTSTPSVTSEPQKLRFRNLRKLRIKKKQKNKMQIFEIRMLTRRNKIEPQQTAGHECQSRPVKRTQQPLTPARTESRLHSPRTALIHIRHPYQTWSRTKSPPIGTNTEAHQQHIPDQIAVYVSEITEEMGDQDQLDRT